MKCLFEKFYAFGIGYQLYNAYEIVIRLQRQLIIDAGLVNKKYRPDVKTATYVECINDICILAAYRQFQTKNSASREICIQIFNKDILIQLL